MAIDQNEVLRLLSDPNNAINSFSDGTVKIGAKNDMGQEGRSFPTDKTASGGDVMTAMTNAALGKQKGEFITGGDIGQGISEQTKGSPALVGLLLSKLGIESDFLKDRTQMAGVSRLLATVGGALSNEGSANKVISEALVQNAAGRQSQSLMQGKELSGIAGYGISPEEYSNVLRQQMSDRQLGAYESQVDKMPDEEERITRALIGASGRSTKNAQIVEINVDKDGKKTSARNKHKWTVDANGQPENYVGPVTSASPSTGADTRNVMEGIYRNAVREAFTDPRLSGLKTEIIDPNTGKPTISWKNPVLGNRLLQKILSEKLGILIETGDLSEKYMKRVGPSEIDNDKTTIEGF